MRHTPLEDEHFAHMLGRWIPFRSFSFLFMVPAVNLFEAMAMTPSQPTQPFLNIGLKLGTDASAMAAQPAPDRRKKRLKRPFVFPWFSHGTKGIFTYT